MTKEVKIFNGEDIDIEPTKITYEEAVALWNAEADEFNSWGSLSDEEKYDWAVVLNNKAYSKMINE